MITRRAQFEGYVSLLQWSSMTSSSDKIFVTLRKSLNAISPQSEPVRSLNTR